MIRALPTVEVGPTGDVLGTALWLHGLGADGHDFESLVPLLELPRVRFVFPNAPSRPVTVNGGMRMPAWYDIRGLGEQRGVEDAEGIRASAQQIAALIAREGTRGVPPSRVILAGFSQGGSLALYEGTRYPESLLGIMVLSGYLVLPETNEAEAHPANARTPMLFCHGTLDPLVPIESGREAYRASSIGERKAEWYEFPMAHQVSAEEIVVIRDWMKRLFLETPS
jgi:phospholipase/carboxylesterase